MSGCSTWRTHHPPSPALLLHSCHHLPAPYLAPDAPALLDSMRRGLVPLVRQGRRGPAMDLDAFLLVCMDEYCDGGWGGPGCAAAAKTLCCH